MKWIKWTHNESKRTVTAPFPMADTFNYTDEAGAEHETNRSDFIATHTFLQEDVQPLPKANVAGIPTVAVTHTPGSPIATPKAPQATTADLEALEAKLDASLEQLLGAVDTLKGLELKLEQVTLDSAKNARVLESLANSTDGLHTIHENVNKVLGQVAQLVDSAKPKKG